MCARNAEFSCLQLSGERHELVMSVKKCQELREVVPTRDDSKKGKPRSERQRTQRRDSEGETQRRGSSQRSNPENMVEERGNSGKR